MGIDVRCTGYATELGNIVFVDLGLGSLEQLSRVQWEEVRVRTIDKLGRIKRASTRRKGRKYTRVIGTDWRISEATVVVGISQSCYPSCYPRLLPSIVSCSLA
jgi:hypothetical protein